MKSIEVIADVGHADTIISIAQHYEAEDYWHFPTSEDGRCLIKIIVANEVTQVALDAIQKIIKSSENARVIVTPVEATLPRKEDNDKLKDKPKSKTSASREELYQTISSNTKLNQNYILLVILSTVVATFGMLENNIAVVIGAMVIAPLLGPNIALTFATVLADGKLMLQASAALLVGTLLALVVSYFLSWIYPIDEFSSDFSSELLSRTHVNYSSVIMALASGAAAALSMTTGLSSVLVGVMVAVAILPPTCALGLMLGYQQMQLAYGAFMLLAINIVCINISGNIVFIMKGIHPLMRSEKRKAVIITLVSIVIWLLLLALLISMLIVD